MSEPQLAPEPVSPFFASAADEVIDCTMAIVVTGAPLPAGLRAAAQESESPRVAAGLRHLAAEIEHGRSLEDCLADARRLPPYVSGAVRAAERSGEMSGTPA